MEYYARQAQALLERAEPLMEIYRSDRAHELNAFLLADSTKPGKRRSILSTLPLHTMRPGTLTAFLDARQVMAEVRADILGQAAVQRQRVAAILEAGELVDELSVLSQGSFDQHPPALDVSGAFCESDLCYTYPEYLTHLQETEQFAAAHPNYTLQRTAAQQPPDLPAGGTVGDGVQGEGACHPLCHPASQAAGGHGAVHPAGGGVTVVPYRTNPAAF